MDMYFRTIGLFQKQIHFIFVKSHMSYYYHLRPLPLYHIIFATAHAHHMPPPFLLLFGARAWSSFRCAAVMTVLFVVPSLGSPSQIALISS